jgi:hypothetical protein
MKLGKEGYCYVDTSIYEDAMNDDGDNIHLRRKQLIYTVRDQEYMCSFTLYALSSSLPFSCLIPGDTLRIQVDFEDAIEKCISMTATLFQCENRIDGTRLQVICYGVN